MATAITSTDSGTGVETHVRTGTPVSPFYLTFDAIDTPAISSKISLRTINQGHSLFSMIIDNSQKNYLGEFDAGEIIEVPYNDHIIFKGAIDSVKHFVTQDAKWNLVDYIRLAGRDLSYELSNKKYTRTFPVSFGIYDVVHEAIDETGCNISISNTGNPTISGHTSEDQYLLDLVTEVFEKADYEGYVDTSGILQYFPVGSISTGITLDDTNVLAAETVEVDGLDIRNSAEVLGKLSQYLPIEVDDWTEGSLEGWTLLQGDELLLNSTYYKIGAKSVRGKLDVGGGVEVPLEFMFTFPETIRVDYHGQFTELGMFVKCRSEVGLVDGIRISLHTTDTDYFHHTFGLGSWWEVLFQRFKFLSLPLGTDHVIRSQEEDSEFHPEGIWTVEGNPDWLNIKDVRWWSTWDTSANLAECCIDGLYIGRKRVTGSAINQSSIDKYKIREVIKVGEANTNEECTKEAEDLVKRLGDPVSMLKVTTPLDTLIVDTWKGLPGHTIEVNLPDYAVDTYRIIDMEIDIAPYNNLKDGYDAIAVLNLVKETALYNSNSVAATINPEVSSLMKKKANKQIGM